MTNHKFRPRLLSHIAFVLASMIFAWSAYDSIGNTLFELGNGNSVAPTTAAVTGQGAGRAQYEVSTIVDAHIFGEVTTSPEPEVTEAPETRLRINLNGLIASADDKLSRAIVTVDGSTTRAYSVGQSIKGTDASVHAVETGRVLLKRGNAIESLTLQKDVLEQSPSPNASRNDNTLTEPPPSVRPEDVPTAGASTDFLRQRAGKVRLNSAF